MSGGSGGVMGECVGEKAPWSMGRPVERREMAVGERTLGDDGWEWKADGILRGGSMGASVTVDPDRSAITTTTVWVVSQDGQQGVAKLSHMKQ